MKCPYCDEEIKTVMYTQTSELEPNKEGQLEDTGNYDEGEYSCPSCGETLEEADIMTIFGMNEDDGFDSTIKNIQESPLDKTAYNDYEDKPSRQQTMTRQTTRPERMKATNKCK